MPSATPLPPSDPLEPQRLRVASRNIEDLLHHAFGADGRGTALVVFDRQSELARDLTAAYRRVLPRACFIDFEESSREVVLGAFDALAPSDLVVLIQSTSFRLDAFRIRIELFRRRLKVIEHPHLARMRGDEARIYLDSLAYDPDYFRGVGRALKALIDGAPGAVIESGGHPKARLVFSQPLEPAKLNIGDYTGMPNVGGQFPIGEVFSESSDLEAVEGCVRIFAFGDTTFQVQAPPRPITLVVERGRVSTALDSTPEFDRVLDEIRSVEGQVWVRELGFGLNRAFSPQRRVTDIGTFERMCGVHLSLGAKHPTYNKPVIPKRQARFHVDVFPATTAVKLGGENLFVDGTWQVPMPERTD